MGDGDAGVADLTSRSTKQAKSFNHSRISSSSNCSSGRTATQRSKIRVLRRFWKSVLGKGSQKGSEKGAFFYSFYSKKEFLRRVLRRGSEKGASRRCLERPPEEYAPLGVRPNLHRFVKRALTKRVSDSHHFYLGLFQGLLTLMLQSAEISVEQIFSRESNGGMEWLGVWKSIFSGSELQISEPEIWQKSLLLQNLRHFPANFGL